MSAILKMILTNKNEYGFKLRISVNQSDWNMWFPIKFQVNEHDFINNDIGSL